MTPKQYMDVYEQLALILSQKYSWERARDLVRMYGMSFNGADPTQNLHQYLTDVFMRNQDEQVFATARDYGVKIPGDQANEPLEDLPAPNFENTAGRKTFISHSSNDTDLVEKIIALVERIGVKPEDIFCSSVEGYGVKLGEDFLERLKRELNNNVLVIFVLSPNFYASPISLCEMGAAWMRTREHIPILIPPFAFTDVKGVFPHSIGLMINDKLRLNSFKESIEEFFNLTPVKLAIWERERDKILKNIEKEILKNSLSRETLTVNSNNSSKDAQVRSISKELRIEKALELFSDSSQIHQSEWGNDKDWMEVVIPALELLLSEGLLQMLPGVEGKNYLTFGVLSKSGIDLKNSLNSSRKHFNLK